MSAIPHVLTFVTEFIKSVLGASWHQVANESEVDGWERFLYIPHKEAYIKPKETIMAQILNIFEFLQIGDMLSLNVFCLWCPK